jgi:hypothetical protein
MITTDPLSTIAGENGSRVIVASTALTGVAFQTLQVTTAGTLTTCNGTMNGVEINFLTHAKYVWADVPLGLLITGKNCVITEITTGTAVVIAT